MLVGTILFAQTPNQWEDSDGDGLYDINEFSKAYSKGYNDWDVDKDGRLDNNEFYNNFYNQLDVNRDGRLTHEEWTAGRRNYGDHIPADRYSENPPQYLSKREFADRFKDTDYYNSYDTNRDGYIDPAEMNQATFFLLDKNRDGKLDGSELENMQ